MYSFRANGGDSCSRLALRSSQQLGLEPPSEVVPHLDLGPWAWHPLPEASQALDPARLLSLLLRLLGFVCVLVCKRHMIEFRTYIYIYIVGFVFFVLAFLVVCWL